MRFLHRAPLRLRIFVLIAGSLIGMIAALSWNERTTAREDVRSAMTGEQEVLLASLDRDLNELLEFGGPEQGTELSRRLSAFEVVKRFYLFDGAGDLQYQYRRRDLPRIEAPELMPDGTWFSEGRLELSRPVIAAQDTVGRVLLVTCTERLEQAFAARQREAVLRFALILVLSAGLAFLLAQQVARPLSRLREFLAQVARRGDYSSRVKLNDAPEWAATAEGVHHLLQEIAVREERLIKLVDEASAANQAKSRFLENMSHELRTPIAAVLGMAEELEQSETNTEDHDEAVAAILSNSEHLLAVLGDILEITKLEAGKVGKESVAFRPAQVVEGVLSGYTNTAAEACLELRVLSDKRIPDTVQGDARRLQQVLRILVGNAIKFTPAGHVEIESRWIEGPEDHWIEFIVSDTGIGLPDGDHEKLFDAFSQADESSTREYGGTGLGLAIARELSELLGGSLRAEDRSDAGSRFVLSIPVGEAAPASLADEKAPADSKTPLANWHILIAEDVPTNLFIATRKLERLGASIVGVENGRLAVDAVLEALRDEEPFDAILMDVQMPVLGGLEAVGELRGQGYGGHIVALTAHALAGDRETCLEAGCDDYATKPIQLPELVRAIRAGAASSRAA